MSIPKKVESSALATFEQIGEDYIAQVRAFGSLGYSPERIASMLSLTGHKRLSLIMRITSIGDTYNTAYFNGKFIGEYNIDAELAKKAEKGEVDAIILQQQRKDERQELDLRRDLFGI
jgi:hypothetical protein